MERFENSTNDGYGAIKQGVSGDAESENTQIDTQKLVSLSPELSRIVKRWSMIPDSLKRAIMAIVDTAN